MLSFLGAAAWIIAALAQPDVILLENQQVTFDARLDVSEKHWNLKDLASSPLTDWSAFRFLVMELKASSPQRFQVTVRTDQGVSPLYLHPFQDARIRAVVPLQMFNSPPRSGSTLSDVFNRQRVGYFMFHWGPFYALNRVQAIGVAMPQPIGKPSLDIRTAYLSTRSPGDAVLEDGPLVDAMGQWIREEWPNKVSTLEELQQAWRREDRELKPGDFGYCRYGGYLSTNARASGFFRVEVIDGVWWIVDPDGHLFLSVGSDVITPMMITPIQDRKSVFSKLPPADLVPYSSERMHPGVSFFHWNVIRRFGEAWATPWVDLTARRMHAWGLNTVGNWSTNALWDAQRLPYTVPLEGWETRQSYFGLPDVFSQEFVQTCDAAAEKQCAKRRSDPYLLGYFIGNEPPWPSRETIVVEMILGGPETATQLELKRYLAAADTPDRRRAFLFRAYEKYLEVVNAAIRKHDPNHLNLGIRFSGGDVPEPMLEASRAFDVFSVNVYEYLPSRQQLEGIYRVVGRPMLIGEFHFGVPGRGMSSGLRQVSDQKQRGTAYQYYVENVSALPMMIGTHWFQWVDEPNTGRSDGENYNIGLVDVTDQPYPEMVEAMCRTHQRLQMIHTGSQRATTDRPMIH